MKKLIILFALFLAITTVSAQEKHRFSEDVKTLVAYDKIYEPPVGAILFIGSSSIRKWQHLQEAFGDHKVINRGIGGAVIDDITYFVDDLIVRYRPRQVILYVGENDLPNAAENADTILNKTITLFNAIRSKLPDVPIAYISLKPSPSRDQYQQKLIGANQKIKDFLSAQQNAKFIDVYSPMISNGKSRPELFLSDMLHMKPEGYAIWEKKVKPVLIKSKKKL
jgi:lysophospholipase L1-like esterase